MADTDANVNIFLRFKDKLSGPFKRAFGKVGSILKRAKSALFSFQSLLLGLGGTLFAKSILDTAVAFEDLATRLNTVSVSAKEAEDSLLWIKDFTAKTPFQLEQVSDAFVKLKSFGIDPTAGALKAGGDAAAAMGKSLDQAVEALTDAAQGEFERLKEFGIKANAAGKQVVFTWTNSLGEVQKTISEKSPDILQQTIETIWNQKYAGAMEDLSQNWSGLWSNLLDIITQWKLEVAQSGPFLFLKEALRGFIEELKRLREEGTLKVWAEQTGKVIVDFFEIAALSALNFAKALAIIRHAAIEVANVFFKLKIARDELVLSVDEKALELAETFNVGGILDESVQINKSRVEALKIAIAASRDVISENLSEQVDLSNFIEDVDEGIRKVRSFFTRAQTSAGEEVVTAAEKMEQESVSAIEGIKVEVESLGGDIHAISDNTLVIDVDANAAFQTIEDLRARLSSLNELGVSTVLQVQGGGGGSVSAPSAAPTPGAQSFRVLTGGGGSSSVSVVTGDINVQGGGTPEETERAVAEALRRTDWRETTRQQIIPELDRAANR